MNFFSFLIPIASVAVSLIILYFVVKWAVSEGVKSAYQDLDIYIKNNIKAAIKDADKEKTDK